MKRLGKYTGTIYGDDYVFSNFPECCTMISDEQADNEEFISKHHINDLKDCLTCCGCPAASGRRN